MHPDRNPDWLPYQPTGIGSVPRLDTALASQQWRFFVRRRVDRYEGGGIRKDCGMLSDPFMGGEGETCLGSVMGWGLGSHGTGATGLESRDKSHGIKVT